MDLRVPVRKLLKRTPFEIRRRARPSEWLWELARDLEGKPPIEDDLPRFLSALGDMLAQGIRPRGQLLQDCFAYSRCPEGPNSFVDCGAGHPERFSNTYALQTGLGWSGVLIDPSPEFAEGLEVRATKGTSFLRRAVGSPGFVEFLPAGELSGVVSEFKNDWAHTERRRTMAREQSLVVERESLDVILSRAFDEPGRLGFLSVDVEGSELDVLHSLDWSHWSFDAVAVEHNFIQGAETSLEVFMHERGYRRVLKDISLFDAWFVPIDSNEQQAS